MYLRTLLYALRQGVALDKQGSISTALVPTYVPTPEVCDGFDTSSTVVTNQDDFAGRVPDDLLDIYLSSEDSISLTSKVLDVYAAYVDVGEVSLICTKVMMNKY